MPIRIAFSIKPYYLARGNKPNFKATFVTVLSVMAVEECALPYMEVNLKARLGSVTHADCVLTKSRNAIVSCLTGRH
jgi:hypothetical protein